MPLHVRLLTEGLGAKLALEWPFATVISHVVDQMIILFERHFTSTKLAHKKLVDSHGRLVLQTDHFGVLVTEVVDDGSVVDVSQEIIHG